MIQASTPLLSAVSSVAIAALVTILLTPLVRRFARAIGAVDAPGGRRQHRHPTPRLGGLAVWTGVAVSALWTATDERSELLPILAIAALVCAFGARDDVRGISPLGKLVGLAVAGLALFASGVGVTSVTIPGFDTVALGWLALPVTVAWILAATNAVNLIDGVDGVGPAVLAVAALGLGAVAYGTGNATAVTMLGATGGAALGFWCHNRHPASIFLGDSGSLLLGFLVASTAMLSGEPGSVLFVAAIFALGVPLLDAGQSFVRRFRAALPQGGVAHAFRQTAVGDRGHVHHRILAATGSPHRVTLVLGAITALLCVCACILVPGDASPAAVVLAVLVSGLGLLRLATIAASEPPQNREAELPTRYIPRRRPARRQRPEARSAVTEKR